MVSLNLFFGHLCGQGCESYPNSAIFGMWWLGKAIYARFAQSPVDCGCVMKLPEDNFADSIVCGFPETVLRIPENDFADSIVCGLQKVVMRTPKDNSAGAQKTIPRIPERQFRRLPMTIPWAHHRQSANFRTGSNGKPRQITVEVFGFL